MKNCTKCLYLAKEPVNHCRRFPPQWVPVKDGVQPVFPTLYAPEETWCGEYKTAAKIKLKRPKLPTGWERSRALCS